MIKCKPSWPVARALIMMWHWPSQPTSPLPPLLGLSIFLFMPLNLYFSWLLNLFRSPFSALVKQNSESTLMLHSSKSPENVFLLQYLAIFTQILRLVFLSTKQFHPIWPDHLFWTFPFFFSHLLTISIFSPSLASLHFLDNKIYVAFCKALARMLLPKFTLGPAQFGPWHIFQFFTSAKWSIVVFTWNIYSNPCDHPLWSIT